MVSIRGVRRPTGQGRVKSGEARGRRSAASRSARGIGTAALGWSPVRDVPPVFSHAVMKAESAAMTWYRDSIASALDDMVASWEWICAHTEFAAAKLSFRLDSLNRCGIGHSIRGDAGGQDEDLTRAEACWRLALTLAPLGLPDRLRYLHNLGTAALQRYHRTSAREQLADAIEHFNQALADVGPSDDEAPLYHDSLAVALTYQYNRQGTINHF